MCERRQRREREREIVYESLCVRFEKEGEEEGEERRKTRFQISLFATDLSHSLRAAAATTSTTQLSWFVCERQGCWCTASGRSFNVLLLNPFRRNCCSIDKQFLDENKSPLIACFEISRTNRGGNFNLSHFLTTK